MATVITSLATVIPVVGKTVLGFLWGGFSVDNPTLNRFYSLHYTLPFVLAGLSIFHIAALHQYGSTNPLGVNTSTSTIPFGSYFGTKDLLGLLIMLFVFACLVFFYPEALGHYMAIIVGYTIYIALYAGKYIYNNFNIQSAGNIRYVIISGRCAKPQGLARERFINSVLSSEAVHAFILYIIFTPIKSNSVPFESTYPPVKPPIETPLNNNMDHDAFNYYLTGFVDGDGSLLITESNDSIEFSITVDSKDNSTLEFIRNALGYGNITPRSNVNASRIRTTERRCILDLIRRLDGKLLTPDKQEQLIKVCAKLGLSYHIPSYEQSINIVRNTTWLNGFFDAEGSLVIYSDYTLVMDLSQKNRFILDIVNAALTQERGRIRFDRGYNGYKYAIMNRNGIRLILERFSTFGLYTTKRFDVVHFKNILSMLDQRYHFQSNRYVYPENFNRVMAYIEWYKNRNRNNNS